MTWADVADQIFTAATSTDVDVSRKLIAGGPTFARDCRQIVVCMLRPAVVPLQREWAGTCAVVQQITWQVVFTADCYPTAKEGSPPVEADVTAWTKAFLTDAGKIFEAILTACAEGDIAGGCDRVSVNQGEIRGPLGTSASMIMTVTTQIIDE